MDPSVARAVLLTGVYGSGKSTVVEEIASVFEERGTPFAALDLDWLSWFDAGWDDEAAEHRLMLENLKAVVGNYLRAGIGFFLLAHSVETQSELDSIRAVLPMTLKVVRLTVPLETIQARIGSDPTTGRQTDLHWASVWLEEGRGLGLEDVEVANDRPIRDVALDVLGRLGWT